MHVCVCDHLFAYTEVQHSAMYVCVRVFECLLLLCPTYRYAQIPAFKHANLRLIPQSFLPQTRSETASGSRVNADVHLFTIGKDRKADYARLS